MDLGPRPASLHEALQRASLFLSAGGHQGGSARTYWLLYKDWTLTDLLAQLHTEISLEDWWAFTEILARLVANEPIQYILGWADFRGRRYKVRPDALIPREETEGILDLVAPFMEAHPRARILDLGTGTGILGIDLSLTYPESQVVISDISPAALVLAEDNAQHHQAQLTAVLSDGFRQIPHLPPFDLIVSNPPYISEDELDWMDDSVKAYEPPLALYAGNQGLACYQDFASQAQAYLSEDFLCVFEIGFRQGPVVQGIMQAAFPQSQVAIHKDFAGLDRYITVKGGG